MSDGTGDNESPWLGGNASTMKTLIACEYCRRRRCVGRGGGAGARRAAAAAEQSDLGETRVRRGTIGDTTARRSRRGWIPARPSSLRRV
jgi:hypothetical protein